MHRRRHTGDKRHGCRICSSRFVKRCELNTHLQKVHGIKAPPAGVVPPPSPTDDVLEFWDLVSDTNSDSGWQSPVREPELTKREKNLDDCNQVSSSENFPAELTSNREMRPCRQVKLGSQKEAVQTLVHIESVEPLFEEVMNLLEPKNMGICKLELGTSQPLTNDVFDVDNITHEVSQPFRTTSASHPFKWSSSPRALPDVGLTYAGSDTPFVDNRLLELLSKQDLSVLAVPKTSEEGHRFCQHSELSLMTSAQVLPSSMTNVCGYEAWHIVA